jgi:hypothetical protein
MRRIELTYCTNVHDLRTPESWSAALAYFGPAVRAHLGWSELPLGLWWQAPIAEQAARNPAAVARFLEEHRLRAFTCNAFPYGDFHEAVVKTKVYRPDWSTPERLAYTKHCASVLAALLPDGGFGTLSTLPLGWRLEWGPEKTVRAIERLLDWVAFASDLEKRGGKRLALALEAEPGCILERTPQVLDFWRNVLLPAAGSAPVARHLGVCYDTCHQAVQYENPEEALGALRDAGIPVHKMQLSSGLEFGPEVPEEERRAFAEPRFLHQTRERGVGGIRDFDDLPEALERADRSLPWRTHFHVPLQAERLLGRVRTTREDMLRAYHFALEHDLCRHFEVETYTWSVMPEAERPADDARLAEALAREVAFVVEHTPEGVAFSGR